MSRPHLLTTLRARWLTGRVLLRRRLSYKVLAHEHGLSVDALGRLMHGELASLPPGITQAQARRLRRVPAIRRALTNIALAVRYDICEATVTETAQRVQGLPIPRLRRAFPFRYNNTGSHP